MRLQKVNGWIWPAEDTECQKVAFDLTSLKKAISLCTAFNVAVQAGGNVGVWPKYLSTTFRTVYTAEPDPDNFACLSANVPDDNVFKLQCGFGGKSKSTPMGISKVDNNCGAGFLSGEGNIPIIELDALNLNKLDLLCLDIEGMEVDALRGGAKTISLYKPIILLEQKGHESRYGYTADSIGELMENAGYRQECKIHRDVIWVPK